MNAFAPGLLRWRWPAAGLALVAVFAVLAGRFWHPHYGFTRFLQVDEADHRAGVAALRAHPVFTYPGFNGYDGAAYAQLAFHPLIEEPSLRTAIDSLPYRARRILGSALAWVLAGGDPARIARTYAALNLAVWLGFAALLWYGLRVADARSWVVWAGVVFSAGALHSVRLALTDLLATTLVTAALLAAERGRPRGAVALLACAGLARETALAAVAGLWRGPWDSPRAWAGNAFRAAVATAPLALWMIHVRHRTGPSDAGFGNFSWPVTGWIEKWGEIAGDYVRHPQFAWLITTTLLATIALTAQAAFLLRRFRWEDPWWRLGATGVAMLALLGTAVWEGHPGAATRVLLPMAVAVAVLQVRTQAAWGWVATAGLSAASGVLALWQVPQDDREVAAGTFAGGSYVARLETGWFGVERARSRTWAWAENRGELDLDLAPAGATPRRVRLRLAALTPRPVEVRQGDALLWRGEVGPQAVWIDVPIGPAAPGGLRLTVSSPSPGELEGTQAGARRLGFAVRGVEVGP